MMSRLTIVMLVFVALAGARCSAGGGSVTIGIDDSPLTNLDLSALSALANFDDAHVRAICRELQKRFQGGYVLELAPLREVANAALPVLEEYDETRPYAAWLRSRLDYFAVANELKLTIPPVSPDAPQMLTPPVNPTPDAERQAWRNRLRMEDLPPGAQMYVARLKPIFIREGVPPELVWLAEVESEFDTLARSPIGAAGLFQLMPDTAMGLGLALAPSDQRLQPEKNARAAARYLKLLYGMFHDWRLAIAAYNGGEGLVGRLLEKRGAHTYDEIASGLPAETQMYVPKVEATIMRREGVKLEELKRK